MRQKLPTLTWLLCVLALVGLAACISSKPVKKGGIKAKPALEETEPASASRKGFYTELMNARLQLVTHHRGASEKALQAALGNVSSANELTGSDSRIFAELQFNKSGLVSSIYVPLKKGSERFLPVTSALSMLKKHGLEPRGFRLVTLNRRMSQQELRTKLESALEAVQDENAAGAGYGMGTADRLVQEIYKSSGADTYESDNSRAVAAHNLQAALALRLAGYNGLSRDALEEAESALRTLGGKYLFSRKPEHLKEMNETAERLAKALDGKETFPRAEMEKALKMEYVNPNTEE